MDSVLNVSSSAATAQTHKSDDLPYTVESVVPEDSNKVIEMLKAFFFKVSSFNVLTFHFNVKFALESI